MHIIVAHLLSGVQPLGHLQRLIFQPSSRIAILVLLYSSQCAITSVTFEIVPVDESNQSLLHLPVFKSAPLSITWRLQLEHHWSSYFARVKNIVDLFLRVSCTFDPENKALECSEIHNCRTSS